MNDNIINIVINNQHFYVLFFFEFKRLFLIVASTNNK